MNTAKGLTVGLPDIHMATAKGLTNEDIRMETVRGDTATVKQPGFQLWEKELLESPEVRRKATVAQLCECPFSTSFVTRRIVYTGFWMDITLDPCIHEVIS